MSFPLNKRSLDNLLGVHADLQKVVKLAATLLDETLTFIVTEGVRSQVRQAQLFAAGATRTMRSRHLDGHAVDLAAVLRSGEIRWDWPLYTRLGSAMKDAGRDLNVPIEWGGDWVSFRDGPHFQLPWETYP